MEETKLTNSISCDLNKILPAKYWFALKEACGLKSINYRTACNRVALQPNGGKSDGTWRT